MAQNRLRPGSSAEQTATTVPERFEFEAAWKAMGPAGTEVEVQLWATRSRDEGAVRTSQGLVLGIVMVEEATECAEGIAISRHGAEWVMTQLHYGRELLRIRAGRS